MMKKLTTILFLATLGFGMVAVAGPHYTLNKVGFTGNTSILEAVQPIQWGSDSILYQRSKKNKITYTVKGTINRILQNTNGTLYSGMDDDKEHPTGKTAYDLAQITFTTRQTTNLTLFTDIDHDATNERRIDSTLNIKDYGIYFLDEDTKEGDLTVHKYYSMMGTTVEVAAEREFGVYYTADTDYEVKDPKYSMNGDRADTVNKTYTTTDNWVGSFDGRRENNHTIDDIWYADMKVRSDEPFFCLFQGPFAENQPAYLEWDHFEFMFTTGEQISGQPLPGTLATLLIGGLCAGALHKRKK